MGNVEEPKVLAFTLSQLRLHRLWPKDGKVHYITLTSLVILVLPLWLSMLLHLITSIIEKLNVDYSDGISMFTSVIGLHFFFVVFSVNHKPIASVLNSLSNFETFGKPDSFDKYNKQLTFFSKLYVHYCFVGVLTYAIVQITVAKGHCEEINRIEGLHEVCGLFTPAWLPFQFDYFPLKQAITAYQIAAMLFLTRSGILVAFSVYETSEHVVLRLKHLQNLLRQAFDVQDEGVCKQRLHHCIRYHIDIIRIFKDFNSAYRTCTAVHILMSSIIFGSICNQMMHYIHLGALLHLCGWVLGCFMACWSGQILHTESLGVAEAACYSKWYNASPSLRKDLIFLIMSAQRPFNLHAGPLAILSLPLFVSICKTSYSYLTLLNQTV